MSVGCVCITSNDMLFKYIHAYVRPKNKYLLDYADVIGICPELLAYNCSVRFSSEKVSTLVLYHYLLSHLLPVVVL